MQGKKKENLTIFMTGWPLEQGLFIFIKHILSTNMSEDFLFLMLN